jgi:hypothetical protein
MKLGYMISNILENTPIGGNTLVEIFSGVLGLLSIYLVWKVYRSLPFI